MNIFVNILTNIHFEVDYFTVLSYNIYIMGYYGYTVTYIPSEVKK